MKFVDLLDQSINLENSTFVGLI